MTSRLSIVAAALTLAAWPLTGAHAQTPTPLGPWQFSAGEVLAPYGEDAPTWRVIVGPGVVFRPEYEGSDNYNLSPSATINVRYKSRLFLSTGEGLGYDFFRGPNHRIGAALAYDTGRNDDVDGIYGMGGVDPAPQVRVFADYVLRPEVFGYEIPFILSMDARYTIRDDDGVTASISAYFPVAGSKEKRYFVFLGGAVAAGDAHALGTYFSVTPAQSASSGLPVYHADAGLRSANVGVNSGFFLSDHWLVTGTTGAKWMIGDVQDSPVVQEQWQFLANISIGYLF